jgi:hypothetical protein
MKNNLILKGNCEVKNFKLIENLNDNTIKVCWDFNEILKDETVFKNSAFVPTGRKISTGTGTYKFTTFDKKNVNINKIKSVILNYFNDKIKDAILRGFVWNGYNVWLSAENQKNYSDWYVCTKDSNRVLPLTAKFSKNGKTIYYEFNSHEEIADLYENMIKHINKVVNENRKQKDSIDWNEISTFLKNHR